MKQTAVEWFAKELNNWRIKEFGEDSIIGIPSEVFEQAKAKERSQKAEEYLKGFKDGKEYQIKLDELTFKSE
jgi:hypothetical protein